MSIEERALRLQGQVNKELAWCRKNPEKARQLYGATYIDGSKHHRVSDMVQPMKNWAHAIALRMIHDLGDWEYRIEETSLGEVTFFLTAYKGEDDGHSDSYL